MFLCQLAQFVHKIPIVKSSLLSQFIFIDSFVFITNRCGCLLAPRVYVYTGLLADGVFECCVLLLLGTDRLAACLCEEHH